MSRIVRLRPWVGIHEASFAIDRRARRVCGRWRGHRLRLADPEGQPAIKRAQRGVRAADVDGGEAKHRGRAIRGGLRAATEQAPPGDLDRIGSRESLMIHLMIHDCFPGGIPSGEHARVEHTQRSVDVLPRAPFKAAQE